jgi:MYXO-CTERM domain-containing protein
VAVLAYAGGNWLLTGAPAPATLSGRRWMWLLAQDGLSPLVVAGQLLLMWCNRLAAFKLGIQSSPVFWPVLGLALLGAATLVRERRRGMGTVLAWVAVHLATYAVLLPAEGHGGR